MPSLPERLRALEDALVSPAGRLSGYHDLPFAIFRYDPEEELELRHELVLLEARLRQHDKQVITISLAELLLDAINNAVGGVDVLADAERDAGIEATISTVHAILTEFVPLDDTIAERLSETDPDRTIAFLTRAGALYPAYRTSMLLEHLIGKVRTPTVLFYPGTLQGTVGLHFMGVMEADHNYRAKIF